MYVGVCRCVSPQSFQLFTFTIAFCFVYIRFVDIQRMFAKKKKKSSRTFSTTRAHGQQRLTNMVGGQTGELPLPPLPFSSRHTTYTHPHICTAHTHTHIHTRMKRSPWRCNLYCLRMNMCTTSLLCRCW